MYRMHKKVIGLCLISLLGGCGKEEKKSSHAPKKMNEELEIQKSEGTYRAMIRPINSSLSGWIPSGMALIKIIGDEIEVQTWMEDAAPTLHHQNIHLGTSCPFTNDFNNDGYIDVQEMIPATKQILIPLDDQMDSIQLGVGSYPGGKNYQYWQKGSLSKIMNELHQSVLSPSRPLNLAGRTIMIHGSSPLKILPESVATIEGKTRQETIPIACGMIEKIEVVSGEGPQ